VNDAFGAIQAGREGSNQGAVAEEKRSEIPERQQEQTIQKGYGGVAIGSGTQYRVCGGNANLGGRNNEHLIDRGGYGSVRNRDEGQPKHYGAETSRSLHQEPNNGGEKEKIRDKSRVSNQAKRLSLNSVHTEVSSPSAIPKAFFVYGSLRPDDITDKSWRDRWLSGGRAQPATVKALLYEDTYAAVVLEPECDRIVKGYFVEFDADVYSRKLQYGDMIEGYPSFYQRDPITVTTSAGLSKLAWIYHRKNCSRGKLIPAGDWVAHCSNKLTF